MVLSFEPSGWERVQYQDTPMNAPFLFSLMADLVLILHVCFVLFVLVGLLLIWIGGWRKWAWIRHAWFRICHLAAIALVVLQAWLGVICPLTTLEHALRERAGKAGYSGSFIAHWLHQCLFFEAPPWVFTLSYSLFGLAVVLSWILFKPKFRRGSTGKTEKSPS